MKPVEKSLNKHSKIAAVAGESGNNLQRNWIRYWLIFRSESSVTIQSDLNRPIQLLSKYFHINVYYMAGWMTKMGQYWGKLIGCIGCVTLLIHGTFLINCTANRLTSSKWKQCVHSDRGYWKKQQH
jgi:hypothetical protein